MKRCIHYEAAFEALLRDRRVPYLAVDEARRALSREHRLKSFDFLVDGPGSVQWLVDVKGRRFARAHRRPPRWETWISQSDLDGLARWEAHFGPDARGLLAFAFWIDTAQTVPADLAFRFRGRTYLFVGLPRIEYARHARIRSRRWGTLTLPNRTFLRLARPLSEFVG